MARVRAGVTIVVTDRGRPILRRLGSLDSIQLATADPFLTESTDLVTDDDELAAAAGELGLPAAAPS